MKTKIIATLMSGRARWLWLAWPVSGGLLVLAFTLNLQNRRALERQRAAYETDIRQLQNQLSEAKKLAQQNAQRVQWSWHEIARLRKATADLHRLGAQVSALTGQQSERQPLPVQTEQAGGENAPAQQRPEE